MSKDLDFKTLVADMWKKVRSTPEGEAAYQKQKKLEEENLITSIPVRASRSPFCHDEPNGSIPMVESNFLDDCVYYLMSDRADSLVANVVKMLALTIL